MCVCGGVICQKGASAKQLLGLIQNKIKGFRTHTSTHVRSVIVNKELCGSSRPRDAECL